MFSPAGAGAQAISQVPGSALVVLHVKNMQDVSTKLASLASELGLTDQQAPAMTDLLGYVSAKTKVSKGLNTTGDFAVAVMDQVPGQPAPAGNNPPILMFIPTTDYTALLSNYPDAKIDGGIAEVNIDGKTAYVANWGNYAVCSDSRDLLSLAPGGLKLADVAAKELDSKDICIVVNTQALRAKALPLFKMAQAQVRLQATAMLSTTPMAKYSSVIRTGMLQGIALAQKILDGCDVLTLGFNLTDNGISSTMVIDLKPDSELGQMVALEQNTDSSMLAGLPDGSYIFFGGGVSNPKSSAKFVNELIDPMIPQLDRLGDDAKPFEKYLQALKDSIAVQTASSYGMVAPQGELGAAPLIQFVATRTGDSKIMSTATQTMMGIQTQYAQPPMQTTFSTGAKTIGDATFDQYHVGLDLTAAQANPQAAMAMQYIAFLYGQDGLNMYMGPVNDTTYLTMGGLSDDMMTAAVAAAKAGSDPLAKNVGVQDTAGVLPKQRVGVFYFSVDTLVNTLLNYAGKFGFDMGVTMPQSDPIGVTMAANGSDIQVDGYVPIKAITGVSDVVKKAMHRNQPPPGGAPSANPGGGL
jgi:hypothetical protein